MPVMEGKSCLFKQFGNVDSIPIVLDTQDTEEIIATVKAIAPTIGGDTAIVVAAGLINALKLVDKKAEDVTVTITGTGAAGNSIIRIMHQLGVKDILAFNADGILIREDEERFNFLEKEMLDITNQNNQRLTLAEAMAQSDVYIGVSAAGIVSEEMVSSMKEDPIVFAMANPEPEITYAKAKAAGARVAGTGRSDSPNQVNNILAFPGIFRGALDCRATKISEEMKMAAAVGLASLVTDEELNEEFVIPDVFDPRVAYTVAKEVVRVARKQGIARL